MEKGIMGSTSKRTYASALTDCWNNLPNSDSTWIICSLCSNRVWLCSGLSSQAENMESSMKRSRMIKNLCHHMKISSHEISNECPRSSYPLCDGCEDLMKELWRIQGILDNMGLKISKVVAKIEKTVVDDEILKPNLKTFPNQNQRRTTQLRDMILDGYRNKLILMRQTQDINESIELNPDVNIKREVHEEIISAKVTRTTSTASSRAGKSDSTEELNVDVHHDVVDVDVEDEIHVTNRNLLSSSSTFFEDQDTPENIVDDQVSLNDDGNEVFERDDLSTARNPEVVIIPENVENGCNLVILNVQGARERIITNNDSSPIQIKQEMNNGEPVGEAQDVRHADQFEFDETDDDDDIYTVEPRQRRLLCEGVEIYKCIGSKKGKEYLQCGLCSFTMTISKKAGAGDTTSCMKMKSHIRRAHTDDISRRAQKRKTISPKATHSCLICSKIFQSKKTLREHKKIHLFQCDICGRTVKGNSHRNLLVHKFSHKNDEERKAALAAGELGSRDAKLSKKLMGKKKQIRIKTQEAHSSEHHICTICNRSFPRKNYLVLHMRAHKKFNYRQAVPVNSQSQRQPPVLQRVYEKGTIEEFCDALGIIPIARKPQ